jgi:internalin A
MANVFFADRLMLRCRGAMPFALALALNNSVLAQDELDNSPALREINRQYENSSDDLKWLRDQKFDTANIYVGISAAGMKELSECDTLWSLGLYGVKVPKAGFKGLGRLKKLNELTIVEAPVTDADLIEIKELGKLASLYLSSPRSTITDAGLKELRPLKNLTRLELGFANITDAGLKELKGFGKLTRLSLKNTRITDAGVRQLADHKNLIDFNLGDTRITDSALKELRGFKNLTTLDLRNTAVTDAGLKDLVELKNLTTLCLIRTRITDAGIKHLVQLNKVTNLWVDHTKITDAGLAELRKALPKWTVGR